MNPDEPVTVVQPQATVQDIIDAHVAGEGGYAIAERFGMDTEKVKQIIRDADEAGKFIPAGVAPDADSPVEQPVAPVVEPLVEGENPEPEVAATEAEAEAEAEPKAKK